MPFQSNLFDKLIPRMSQSKLFLCPDAAPDVDKLLPQGENLYLYTRFQAVIPKRFFSQDNLLTDLPHILVIFVS